MFRQLLKPLLAVMVACALGAGASAQGIELDDDAVVLFGTAITTTRPATIDWETVRDHTPEWQTIKSQRVGKGTARYSLLISDMTKRIKKLCKSVAHDNGNDCVVREGDIADDNGLSIEDLTDQVVKLLESEDGVS